MAEFLTTNGTSYRIETIIMDAHHELTLVSPYLQLSKTFFERLKDASRRKVKIRIIYGKDELKPDEKNALAKLENIELYYFENLHAKCYFNETDMVITSMNMYEFSEKNNREMGVHISKNDDTELFAKAARETSSIIQSAENIPLVPNNGKSKKEYQSKRTRNGKKSDTKSLSGFCIRCTTRISYDVEKPYCWDCFGVRTQSEKKEYTEKVCHRCGKPGEFSISKPVCIICYKKHQKKPVIK